MVICKHKPGPLRHRRRINTEEKTKVVGAVGGTEVIQFLAMLHYKKSNPNFRDIT